MMDFVSDVLTVIVTLFVLALGVGALALVLLYVIDVTQTEHAIRRNYPVIGRFRYLFEEIGEFFRQYFFAMDREEMPFNRARTLLGLPRRQGSRQHGGLWLHPRHERVGALVFREHAWPTLDQDAAAAAQ